MLVVELSMSIFSVGRRRMNTIPNTKSTLSSVAPVRRQKNALSRNAIKEETPTGDPAHDNPQPPPNHQLSDKLDVNSREKNSQTRGPRSLQGCNMEALLLNGDRHDRLIDDDEKHIYADRSSTPPVHSHPPVAALSLTPNQEKHFTSAFSGIRPNSQTPIYPRKPPPKNRVNRLDLPTHIPSSRTVNTHNAADSPVDTRPISPKPATIQLPQPTHSRNSSSSSSSSSTSSNSPGSGTESDSRMSEDPAPRKKKPSLRQRSHLSTKSQSGGPPNHSMSTGNEGVPPASVTQNPYNLQSHRNDGHLSDDADDPDPIDDSATGGGPNLDSSRNPGGNPESGKFSEIDPVTQWNVVHQMLYRYNLMINELVQEQELHNSIISLLSRMNDTGAFIPVAETPVGLFSKLSRCTLFDYLNISGPVTTFPSGGMGIAGGSSAYLRPDELTRSSSVTQATAPALHTTTTFASINERLKKLPGGSTSEIEHLSEEQADWFREGVDANELPVDCLEGVCLTTPLIIPNLMPATQTTPKKPVLSDISKYEVAMRLQADTATSETTASTAAAEKEVAGGEDAADALKAAKEKSWQSQGKDGEELDERRDQRGTPVPGTRRKGGVRKTSTGKQDSEKIDGLSDEARVQFFDATAGSRTQSSSLVTSGKPDFPRPHSGDQPSILSAAAGTTTSSQTEKSPEKRPIPEFAPLSEEIWPVLSLHALTSAPSLTPSSSATNLMSTITPTINTLPPTRDNQPTNPFLASLSSLASSLATHAPRAAFANLLQTPGNVTIGQFPGAPSSVSSPFMSWSSPLHPSANLPPAASTIPSLFTPHAPGPSPGTVMGSSLATTPYSSVSSTQPLRALAAQFAGVPTASVFCIAQFDATLAALAPSLAEAVCRISGNAHMCTARLLELASHVRPFIAGEVQQLSRIPVLSRAIAAIRLFVLQEDKWRRLEGEYRKKQEEMGEEQIEGSNGGGDGNLGETEGALFEDCLSVSLMSTLSVMLRACANEYLEQCVGASGIDVDVASASTEGLSRALQPLPLRSPTPSLGAAGMPMVARTGKLRETTGWSAVLSPVGSPQHSPLPLPAAQTWYFQPFSLAPENQGPPALTSFAPSAFGPSMSPRLLGNGNSLAGNLPTMQTPSFSQSMSQEWPISRPGEMLTSNIENWNSQDMSSMPQQAENHLIPPLFQQEPGGTFSGRNVSGSFIPGTLTRQSSLTGEYIPPAAVYPAGAGKESYPATVPYSGLEYGDSNSQSDVTEYQTSSEYGDYPRRRASKRHRTARSSATQFSGMPLSSPAYQPYPSQPPHAHAPPSIPYQQYPQPPYAESTSAVSPPLAADTDELSATARLAAAKAMQLAEERKRRGHSTAGSRSLPPGALEILREWLFSHFEQPYPTEDEKERLAQRTGLTKSQVNYWMINARVRIWKPMLKQQQLQQQYPPRRK